MIDSRGNQGKATLTQHKKKNGWKTNIVALIQKDRRTEPMQQKSTFLNVVPLLDGKKVSGKMEKPQ